MLGGISMAMATLVTHILARVQPLVSEWSIQLPARWLLQLAIPHLSCPIQLSWPLFPVWPALCTLHGGADTRATVGTFVFAPTSARPVPMSQPDSQPESQLEDMPVDLAARQSLWDEIESWAKARGKRGLIELLEGLDNEYSQWLSTELGLAVDAPCTFETSTEAPADVPLTWLSADPSRHHGYRSVSAAGLQKKMRDITIAGEWRSWDIAVVCRIVAAPSEEPPTKKLRKAGNGALATAASAVLGAVGPDAAASAELVYLDFHHRGCALHVLCALHRLQGQGLPEWLKAMAARIPFSWRGGMTRAQLVAEGVASGISMQEGIVKQSWLDLVLEIMENSTDASTIQSVVESICPEHAASITNWQHLKDLLNTRVSPRVYQSIQEFMIDNDLSIPPLPMACLLGCAEVCAEAEQVLAVKEMLARVSSADMLNLRRQQPTRLQSVCDAPLFHQRARR